MSFFDENVASCAFWVTENGCYKPLTPKETAALPVDGRMELSLLPIKNCRDVLVDNRSGKSTMIWDARIAKRDTIDRSFELANRFCSVQEIRFHTFIDAWLTTDFDNQAEAQKQLDWMDAYRNIMLVPHTSISEKNINDLPADSSFLNAAFCAWREAAKGGDPDCLFKIVDHALLYELVDKGGPIELVYPGRHHPISLIYGGEWQRRTVTMAQLQSITDTRYEERVIGAYDDVISTNEPRYDHIHAFVRVQNGLPRWARYRRLLLPWPAVGAAQAIYCLAEPTNRIDIPFLEVA